MADPYQNNVYHQGGGDPYGTYGEGGDQEGYGYQGESYPQEEDAASDATEGHDDEDQMYEGEYQGIPHPDEVKAAQRAARAKARQDQAGATELEELAEQYEDIMEDCGHGRFQWSLFIVLGLALMADGVECFVVGFVLPSAEKDMCLSNGEKGMLGLIVFLGMMVGAFIWGGMADKLGRRKCLIWALTINCVFAFLSSFAQGYGFFLFFRLISGIGIGGSVPIVYSYFSEFLQMDKRGEHLSWLCMFWMVGGIYASFTAWGIIPHYGWGFSMGTEFQFHSWRVFVLVCALPAITSLVGLMFMPESPRFLLENAKHDEAWMILKNVHDTNWRAKGQPEKVFQVPTLTPTGYYYYGLGVWFPDMIKYLQQEEYESKVKVFHRERVERFHFNFSLENQIHREGEYINDKFINIQMKSVKFEDSLFEDCYFEDIESTETIFENCTIRSTVFYNTDLYEERFIDCRLENTTFLHNKKGCHLDIDEENDVLIYLVSFLGSLAVLPGNIISALFMEKIGRVKIIGLSMLISAGCTFFLFLSFSQAAIIAWQCLFCGVSVAAWNGIEVITVELYPASKRATAFGVLNALCKLAAILGTSIFASFVGVTKVVPILLSCTALVCGGLVALKLPETREKILQ
uniref:Major facilitator superfamily (MFS) profile domain-containing protein n=1 Tax=Oncorhynchus tshawytscha TaxID=74940 RepID=A0A8C8JIV5_ONCTS